MRAVPADGASAPLSQTAVEPREIEAILDRQRANGDGVIAALTAIQSRYNYLPTDALKLVAKRTGHALVDLYAVATFYRSFSLEPRGRHLVSVCMGTACHVRGARTVRDELERALNVRTGETTSDREFTLETVNCLGACALGPVVVADGDYYPHVQKPGIKRILRRARRGDEDEVAPTDPTIFPVEVSCPRCNHTLMCPEHPIDNHPSIRVTVSFNRTHGWLLLSCLWGSFHVESEVPIPFDAQVDFFCPHCHAELRGVSSCHECGAPMVPMIVRRGGMVEICSRRGCRGHMLDLSGVNF